MTRGPVHIDKLQERSNGKMRHSYVSLIAIAAVAGATTLPAAAADKVSVRFATVGIGSAWYAYGAGIADMVKAKLPAGSSVDVLPVAGGVGNIKLLQKGGAEFGISFPMPAAEGCGGFGAFKKKHDKVRGVLGGLDTYYFGAFVTAKSGVSSWSDIAAAKNDFRLLTAKVGGTGEVGVRQVLGLLGTTKKKISTKGGSVRSMARKSTASAISDGKADGWSHVVTRGHPVATQLTTTTSMKMLGLPASVIKGMVSNHGWLPAEVPANTFKGQSAAVKTVGAASNIMTHAGVPDSVVYTFVKTVMENSAKVRKIHGALSGFDPKKAVSAGLIGNCPVHPGARKYFKEAGLI